LDSLSAFKLSLSFSNLSNLANLPACIVPSFLSFSSAMSPLEIQKEYKVLLYKTLEFVITQFLCKDIAKVSTELLMFSSSFLAVIFFRIFNRKELERVLLSCFNGFGKSEESNNFADQACKNTGPDDITRLLFSHYDFLERTSSEDIELEKKLKDFLLKKRWFDQVDKNELFFDIFISEYVTQIQYILSEKDINWELVPAYKHLISIFINIGLQKTNDESLLHDNWLNASKIILKNHEMLQVLLDILYQKTNALNHGNVVVLLKVMNDWLSRMIRYQCYHIPSSFDFEKFLNIIEILLDFDHYETSMLTLIMINNCMHLFFGVERKKFFDFLIGEKFVDLALHWCREVRITFLKVIVYSVERIWKHGVRNLFLPYMEPPKPRRLDAELDGAEKKAIPNLDVTIERKLASYRVYFTNFKKNFMCDNAKEKENRFERQVRREFERKIQLLLSNDEESLSEIPLNKRAYIPKLEQEYVQVFKEYQEWKKNQLGSLEEQKRIAQV
jgi:hypothetical protein